MNNGQTELREDRWRLSGSLSTVQFQDDRETTVERRDEDNRCFRQIECMRKLLVAIGVVLVALAAIGKAAEVRDELADAAEEAEEEE